MKINLVLLIFDFIILPITILRLIIIYWYGSYYNIKFIDNIFHSEYPTFSNYNDDDDDDLNKILSIDDFDSE